MRPGATDLHGLPHVDDPLVADTGTGTCHADGGAFELQDQIALTFGDGGTSQGIVPFALTITINSGATSPWNEPVSYSVDFGDGSGPQSVPAGGSVAHTYTVPGPYELTVTAADTGGSSVTRGLRVVAGTVSPPSEGLSTGPDVFSALTPWASAAMWESSSSRRGRIRGRLPAPRSTSVMAAVRV